MWINNHVADDQQLEQLKQELKQAQDHINWLEQEVARLHRLLSNPWSFSDGFRTTKQKS